VSSICEKHNIFEEVYTGSKIKCNKNVKNCPKSIVVKAKDVNIKTKFKFIPATDSEEHLEYTINIDWCDNFTFDKNKTYVKVRKNETDGGELIILLASVFMALIFGCCIPDNKYGNNNNDLLLYSILLSNGRRRKRTNWGNSNKW
tara:strand:+ start:254 stop:688 length:435 start_codon:yes stop_codon:yes gene_type:complete